MSATQTITASARQRTGTAECRRLRKDGLTPGNIYGHGEGSRAIKMKREDLLAVLHAGQQVVEVDIEGEKELAMFQEVQWDTFSQYIQHFDMIRVDASEQIEANVTINLQGQAPGAVAGGILDQLIYELPIRCSAVSIPDSFELKVVDLQIGDELTVADLEIPAGVTTEMDPESVVVHVTEPMEVPDTDEEDTGPIEPELIGKDSEDDTDEG